MPPVKKYFSHPVTFVTRFERVGVFLVGEYVHEQRRARLHPRGHPLEQRVVVAHVLEHLDRDHPVEQFVP